MKKLFYTIILSVGICTIFTACDNGQYQANPGNSVGGINPLRPLSGSEFTWSGTAPLSCLVNGAAFQADSSATSWTVDTSGGNIILGFKTGGTQGIALYLKPGYSGPTPYTMGYQYFNNYGTWIDSVASATSYYYSYTGNAGEVLITENDTASGNYIIKGKFYFIGISSTGAVVAITNGYFDIKKPI
jgi:hypothetical protein